MMTPAPANRNGRDLVRLPLAGQVFHCKAEACAATLGGMNTTSQTINAPSLTATVLLLVSLPGLGACAIDRSVSIAPGERHGATRVIDGDVDVERGASAGSVRVIDGSARLAEDSAVGGSAHITDGNFVMREGSQLRGGLVAHHAELQISGASIDGEVRLFCTGGRIDNSRIAAPVTVRKKALWHVSCERPQRLIIGPGSEIDRLVIETTEIDVEISDGATIGELVRL